MRAHINVSSMQVVQSSTKLRNCPNFFTHDTMHIIQAIFMIGDPSSQYSTSSMVSLSTDLPGNNTRHPESVPMIKQEQFTQVC